MSGAEGLARLAELAGDQLAIHVDYLLEEVTLLVPSYWCEHSTLSTLRIINKDHDPPTETNIHWALVVSVRSRVALLRGDLT